MALHWCIRSQTGRQMHSMHIYLTIHWVRRLDANTTVHHAQFVAHHSQQHVLVFFAFLPLSPSPSPSPFLSFYASIFLYLRYIAFECLLRCSHSCCKMQKLWYHIMNLNALRLGFCNRLWLWYRITHHNMGYKRCAGTCIHIHIQRTN